MTQRNKIIMISITHIKNYCQDYQNIQNYAEAVKSPLRYDLHHRREISEHKSKSDLIEENLYYNRPATELIFLERGEHARLHNAGKQLSTETRQKISDAKKGHLVSEDTRNKMSDAKKGHLVSEDTRNKMSAAQKGEKSYMYGKRLSADTKQKISAAHKGLHWHLENGHRVWTE